MRALHHKIAVSSLLALCAFSTAAQKPDPCTTDAKACLALSLEAVGGADRLTSIKTLGFESLQNTLLTEQSYRQAPFITSYTRTKGTIDFARHRLLLEIHLTWPESDPGQFESSTTAVLSPNGGVRRGKSADSPASLASVESARYTLALSPIPLLLTAQAATGLHFAAPETIRGTLHPALAFDFDGRETKILINPFNHLPDAVERITTFEDFWREWGDVTQRIYYDNWQTFHGIVFPLNAVEERNGILWQSTQLTKLDFNVATTDDDFKMDAAAAAKSLQFKISDLPFDASQKTELAPGITFYPGAWNATIIRQDDGIVILESPLSGGYTAGIINQAKLQYPNLPIKCVLSTSDSWPHVAGVRQAVSLGIPVYILDLNQPLLDRMVAAPHTIHPDALAQSPKSPHWQIVSGKTVVGSGENRVELYPLRGASTERQYMVYFPSHKILYASDTLVLNEDGSLYDPELMREVVAAATRNHLDVTTVFAMHQEPVPWSQVQSTLAKSMN